VGDGKVRLQKITHASNGVLAIQIGMLPGVRGGLGLAAFLHRQEGGRRLEVDPSSAGEGGTRDQHGGSGGSRNHSRRHPLRHFLFPCVHVPLHALSSVRLLAARVTRTRTLSGLSAASTCSICALACLRLEFSTRSMITVSSRFISAPLLY